MKEFIFLTGVPGVGKTTIINEAIKLKPSLRSVNYGQQLLNESKYKFPFVFQFTAIEVAPVASITK